MEQRQSVGGGCGGKVFKKKKKVWHNALIPSAVLNSFILLLKLKTGAGQLLGKSSVLFQPMLLPPGAGRGLTPSTIINVQLFQAAGNLQNGLVIQGPFGSKAFCFPCVP